MHPIHQFARYLWTPVLYLLGLASAAATPMIFNSTESAAPGNLIYLQGDNFTTGTNVQVWVHRVLTTDATLTPDVQLTPLLANTNQAISVELSKKLPMGLYAVWVKDSSGNLSAPAFINRARAMSFEYAEVPAGYKFRIFGRNLNLAGVSPIVTFTNGSSSYTASVVTSYPNDGNVLQVTAPATLPTSGTFTVKVTNGYGHNTSLTTPFDVTSSEQTIVARTGGTDVFSLGVPWGPDFANIAADVINVVTSTNPHTSAAYGADPSGVANSINAIQQAIYDAGNVHLHPNGATVYLPTGTYLINNSGESTTFYGTAGTTITQPVYIEIVLPSHVVIKGDGVGSTIISDATSGMPYPNRAINYTAGSSLIGLLNFTYKQTGAVTTSTPPPIVIVLGSESFCSNVTLQFAYNNYPGAQGGSLGLGGGGSHDILAQNINLDHGLFSLNASVGVATYGIARNNTLTHHGTYYRSRILTGGMQNMLFENNHCTRDGQWPGADAYEQGGLDSGNSSYFTVLNNTFDSVNLPLEYANDGETIAAQGQPVQYDYHTVGTATANTISDPSRTWTTNVFAGNIVAIVNGPGMGQWRYVASNTANTVTLTTPWTEPPTSASTYALTGADFDHILIKNNVLSDQNRGIVLYTGSHDSAVVNNLLYDTGETIYLRSDQRNTNAGAWYGRMNLTWNDVVTDNLAINTKGTWAMTVSAELYKAADSPTAGTIMLGNEFRRNIIVSDFTNKSDSAIGLKEGYNNWSIDYATSYTQTNIPALLTTVFDDNESINTASANTNYPDYVNTDTYDTSFLNQLNLGTFSLSPHPYSDATITGATNASIGTTWALDSNCLQANFSGTGTNTGGAADMIDNGAAGNLVAGTGTNSISVVSSTASSFVPFTPTSGEYLECVHGTTGNLGYVNMKPTTSRTSWSRIFDNRTGDWLVNGGYDFFIRPQVVTSQFMRPLDISNGDTVHGLRLTFIAIAPSTVRTEVITGTGGGGVEQYVTYPGTFTAGQIYHMGVTFSTNPATGVTTEKIFAVAGTGAINTTVSTNLLGTTTFTLNPSVLTNISGFLSGGAWAFGDGASGLPANVTNDYDCFRLWAVDPGSFPGL